MSAPPQDVRWEQRFDNYRRALTLLRTALEGRGLDSLSDLEREGLSQRFEYTFELAWKVLKDYLEYSGIILDQVTPRSVIKVAFASGVIPDGQAWIDMLAHRNLLSHTYDAVSFRKATEAIVGTYIALLQQLHDSLSQHTSAS